MSTLFATSTTAPLPDAVVSSQLAAAYAINQTCLICRDAVVRIADAAYISSRDRIVHSSPCLARYVAWATAFRGPRIRAAGRERAALEKAFSVADDELARWIDMEVDAVPPYVTVRAPTHFCGSQKELFRRRLLDLIDLDPPLAIVIDMTDTRYVDASSLGILISAKHAFRREAPRGRMFLLGVNDDIRTLLNLTRLETMFDLVATYQEVEDALNG